MLLTKTLRSSTLRLVLVLIAVFGAAVCALLVYVYQSTDDYLSARQYRAIQTEQSVLRQAFDRAGRDELSAAIARRLADQPLGGRQYVYLLADAAFIPITGNLAAWPGAFAGAEGWGTFRVPETNSVPEVQPDIARRLLLRGGTRMLAQFRTLPDGSRLLVGRDVEDVGDFAVKIERVLAFAALVMFLLACLSSIFVAHRAVTRIETINATSRAIMQRGLGERIPLMGTKDDEWHQLAANLNLMLDRIEGLMAEVKQVGDTIAHDLRTPLTRMRGRLERALARPQDRTRDHALIGDTIADLDAVLRMFASITRISQIEANARMAAFHSVNLVHLANEVVELFDAAAEEKRCQLSVVVPGQSVPVTGDRDLLFDALANLIDNAIKHGREGGQISVKVAQESGGGTICVADDGPGIPVTERQQVFKRFYRLERSQNTSGSGLGLSLVAAVARLHGARIELLDNAPGLRLRLVFPPPTPVPFDVPLTPPSDPPIPPSPPPTTWQGRRGAQSAA